tara:strand:- start:437 stop:856 length:420 start_codon:yes stop_codon:yes gene_type:complete
MKYPIIRTFFDADSIACLFVSDVISAYPNIENFTVSYPIGNDGKRFDARDFNSFAWGVDGNTMASEDAQLFIRLYNDAKKKLKEGETFKDIDVSMICRCSVSDKLLMPEDEAYVDGNTGAVLSGEHSIYDDEFDFYVKF